MTTFRPDAVSTARAIDDLYPLTALQRGMLFHSDLAPGEGVYWVQHGLLVEGDLDPRAFRRAWELVFARHAVLRTTVAQRDAAVPLALVSPAEAVPLPLTELDWRDRGPDERETALDALMAEDRARGADLGRRSLVRIVLVRLAGGRHQLVWSHHHLLLDGWSAQIVLTEVLTAYGDLRAGRPPRLPARRPFRDYVAWLGERNPAEDEEYWTDRLDGVTEATPLGVDGVTGERGVATHRIQLPEAVTARLAEVARARRLTLNTVAQGAWARLLAAYSGENDVVYGVTVSARGEELDGVDSMVGLLVNTLPCRTSVDPGAPVAEWLRRLQDDHARDRRHQHASLVRIQACSGVPAGRPLFTSLYVFESHPADELDALPPGGLEVTDNRSRERADYPVTMVVAPGRELRINLTYDRSVLDAGTAERLAAHYAELLTAIADDPSRPVARLAPAPGDVAAWNATSAPIPRVTAVHELIAGPDATTAGHAGPDATTAVSGGATVVVPGEATAVVCGDRSLTYAELHARSNRLAHHLQSLGVGPEVVVGLCLERGIDFAVALLAIWKAGGAYLPLDPAYPADRLAYMTADSGARIVVARGTAVDGCVTVRPDAPEVDAHPDTPPRIDVRPGQLAYVIYTSGSTGRPKGVQAGHRGLVNRLAWMQERRPLAPGEGVLHKTPASFDVSLWELLWPLTAGGRLVMAEPGRQGDVDHLIRLIEDEDVAVAHFVPSLFHRFVLHEPFGEMPSLRLVVCSGEALSGDDVARFYARHAGADVENLYGPTEASIEVSSWTCPRPGAPGDAPPIGRPIANLHLHVLDEWMEPVAPGVPGELFIGGAGVARGYAGRPDLSAERFVADPFTADGSRLYRTGDRARRRADGTVEYLGRLDHQVKVRGFRVEPGEIEAALVAHPGVAAAAVLARDERLVGYAVPADLPAGLPQARDLREHLRSSLPDHLVPAVFVEVTALPLNASGKLDRAALPAPEDARPDALGALAAARTPTEEILAGIWARVLGLPTVGVHDDFFELGGHSLLATQVVSRIRAAFGVEAALSDLFDHPTVRGLAAAVEAMAPGAAVPPVRPARRDRPLPLSHAQRRLWFLDRLEPGSAEYVLPMALRLHGPLDAGALAAALDALVERHEVLRTRLVAVDGEPVQIVDPPSGGALTVTDARDGGLPEAEALVAADAAEPFDLAEGPLLRARLVLLGPDDHVLSLCMHHVVSDAWSAGLIRHELAVLYEALSRGEPSPLPPLPVQYADFAVWQRDHLDGGPALDDGIAHWRNRLADAPPLDLPATRPRPPVRTPAGAALDFRVPEATAAALRDVARESGATMFMTLLAAFAALLGRYAGQDDVVVGTPVAGRDRAETEGLVGFFVNTLVLRADLSGDPTFAEAVARVRREALDAYAHRDVPFERLVDALSPERDRSRTPLFQVMFDYAQGGGPGTDGFGDFTVERVRVPSDTAAFDLALVLADGGDETGLTGRLEYSTELFDAPAIERLAGLLCTVLDRVADGPSRHLSDLARLETSTRRPTPLASRPGGAHELMADAASDDIAVTDGRRGLTYAELDSRAGRLARRLRDEGAGPETVVALHLPRDVDLIVAVVAVWKAGGAYLSLDPDDPPERTAHKLADSGARIVLAHEDIAADVPAGARVLNPSDLLSDEARPLSEDVVPGQLAAVVYTSGSTGHPKGVHITHGSLTSLYAAWAGTHFAPDARYRWLCAAGAGFDVFTGDVVRALGSGGTLVLAPVGLQARAPDLARAISEHGVNAFEAAPRFVDDLAEHLERTGDRVDPLRLVVVTTDTWTTSGVRHARRVLGPDVRLLTAFGITEATVDSTYSPLADVSPEDTATPIGGPLPGTVAHVLDRHLAPLPPGVPGELYLGGPGLARGYGGRPGLTAERFVPDPFAADGSRLYRSGDRVRLRPDGELDFLGRTDHQVKVRGFRIEPGEVEAALTARPDVAEAVVVARGDRLAAYLVPADASAGIPSAAVLRALVRERLPEAMTPSAFVEIAAVPLTRHGKLDRAALPDPGEDRPDLGRAAVAPRTPAEEEVAGVWREVLGVADVGVHDTFFELGGHSLLAVRALWRLGEVFGTEPSLADLFDHPTVAGLAALLDRSAPGVSARPIAPRTSDDPAPASFAQRRLWFLDQLDPGSTRYNVPLTLRLTGPLDSDALTAALDGVVARHEALRTRLVGADDDVVQIVGPPRPFGLTVLDLAGRPDAEAEAEDLVAESTATPFDLAAGPLVRGTLIRLGDGDHVLSLCMHHVVCDEWSSGVLWRELSALYAAFSRGEASPLPPLTVQYADFAAWQRDLLSGETLDEQLGYWRERLAGAAELDLPTDRPRPAARSAEGGQVPFAIPDETAARLRDLARSGDATMFMTLLSAFALLLGRYAGGEDVVVGAPVAGRGRAELDGLVGFFLNTVVLRTSLSGDPTVAELLGRVRAGALGAFAHQDVPFEQVVDALAPDRDPGRNPLFQVLFDVERADAAMTEGLPGLDVAAFGRSRDTTPFDLSIVVIDGDGLSGALEYSTDLFDADTVRRMAAEFVALLGAFAADPDRRLSELAWPDADERRRLIAEGNDTDAPMPSVGGVHELFDAQAAATPDATAVVSDGRTLDYAALADRSTRLAHHLRGLGVGRDDVVGLCVTGGVDLAVSVLGVLKAGAAYLPLDPAHPDERLGRMLADCGVRVAIGQAGTMDRLAAHPVQAVDAADPAIAAAPAAELPRAHPDQLAFVIYTSGSTGRPKGVLLTHRGLVNVLAWRQATFALRPGERMLQKTAIGFDAATGEILWPLSAGGTVVMADPGRRADLDHLVALVRDERIDVLDCVPSLFRLLVRQDGFAGAGLRLVVCGGEALSGEDVARFQDADPDAAVHNVYGPTEASIDVSAWASPRPADVSGVAPIGGPVANTRLYVLDASLNPVPDGAPGELFIAGAGLARGYAAGPGLTAGRFVPDPFAADGSRMYRSGDRVRRRRDGALAFLGRTDGQLKIRGIRVEPGEVEAALRRHPAVAAAAVTARDGRLTGYAVPADPAAGLPAPDELRAFLRTVLPAQLVPAAVVELASLPVRANGKLDTGALPEPDLAPDEPSAPRTPAEEVLAGIWARVLDLPGVGATDDFFALGGHSLLATRVVSRIRTAFETELPVAALFEHPTVRGLAEAIGAAATGLTAPPLVPVARDGLVPASFAQQRLWFQDQLEPGSTDFNVPVALRLRGPLDTPALSAAVDAVVERHEALRTRFRTVDGTATQVIDPPGTSVLRIEDLTGQDDPLARATALAAADAATPFDLAEGPLCRWRLYRLGPDDHVFTMVMHHIVCDEWSAGVLRREIAALYGAFRDGRPSPLAPLPVQYADYAVWQRELLSGDVLEERLGHWRDRLADAPVLDVPADRPRPPVRTSSGAVAGFDIPDATGRGLRELSRASGATLFMTLLAAYAVLLARFTGQDDVLVGTPDAGRDRAETEGLAGFFVNTLVLRADLSGDPAFAEVVARIRRDALAAFAHRDVPFEQVVDGLRPVRDRSRTPVFQALFNYDRDEDGAGDRLDLPGLDAAPLGIAEPIALTDVRLAFTDAEGDGLGGIVEYSTDLFDRATVERLVDRLRLLLDEVVADPTLRLSQLAPLPAPEHGRLVTDWNRTEAALPDVASVADMVSAWALTSPDAPAVTDAASTLTYARLDADADRLAHHLRALGAGPETVVGLCLPRGADMVTAMLAANRAGAAFLPLDPALPAERLAHMVTDGRASVLVGTDGTLDDLPAGRVRTLELDDAAVRAALDAAPRGEDAAVHPDGLAYVIHTSGSTGRPKGVHVTHRALLNLVAAQHDAVGVTPDDVALQFASFGFDAAVSEVFMALAYGASLVVAPSEARRDPGALTELIRAHGVTVATLPPALLEVLAPDDLPGLRTLLAAGERLDGRVARAWARDRRLFNAYGPTETAVCASMGLCEADAEGEPPIGPPIANTRAYVLDASLRPTPIGVPGELYVGGVGVARGYGGRPDLTAERFAADPFAADGSRLYRTGDRVRWDAAGRLVHIGRADGQVKVRGFRVEPAEVEAALTALPQVRSAVVVAHGEGAGRRLVAYAVPADAEAGLPDAVTLRAALRPSLPEHLTPSAFVELAGLPLTANGKVDRAALPDPGESASGTAGGTAPSTPTEEILAGIWTELLGHAGIGGDGDFFALGGHSLLATQVMSRVRAALGVEAPVAWLFDHPTPAGLGRMLDAAAPAVHVPPITPVPRDRPLPLSFAQQRVWFLDQLAPGSAEHNVPTTFRLDGRADPETVQAALDALVRRHEVLRTRFVPDEHGVAHQVIDPDPRVTLAVTDAPFDAERVVADDASVPFDPGAGPLMRARLLRFGPDDHVLCVVLHHAVSDEWSAGILIREFTALHDALRAGRPADLPPLPVQYADVAVWQREWLSGDVLAAELDHWRGRIADAAPLELPTDRPRPAVRSAEGDAVAVDVPPETAAGLRALSRRSGATMFMTLLASYAVLLGRIAGQDDVLVGTPVAGRNRAEAEGLIGCFVNTLALRADLSGDPAPAEVLARVRADALDAYAHQDLPFEKLVDALVVERDRSRHPLVQVLFNYDGEVPETPPVAPPGNRSTRFDLRLVLSDTGEGGLSGALEYSTELFDRATAERHAAAFGRILETFGAAPDRPLSAFTLASGEDRRLLGEWAGSGRALPETIGVHRLVRGEPDAAAVVSGEMSLTYRDLDERTGRLAGYLRGLGVGPETVVGVCLPRGLDLVTTILAVWRAGGAYVPLDPALPPERLAFVLSDGRASLLVGAEDTVGDLPAGRARMVVLDDAFTQASVAAATPLGAEPVHPERLAYVIYTSGSTGRPKGVQVTHGGLTAYVRGVADRFGFGAGTYGMVQSAVTDFGNTMLFGALVSGGTLHLIDERTATDPALLRAYLAGHPIDHLKIVPSHLAALATGGLDGLLPARTLVFGGEAAPAGLVDDVLAVAGDRAVMNHYGPTEATVGVATSRLVPGDGVPIGRPLPHARLHVLDASLNPVPVGVPGELFIAGVGLARGYIGRPDLTADRFVPDPFAADGARMYRSGDRARWRPDGRLEFLGRTDAQVKVRGHRVEPGEVEAALTALPDVAAAVVVAGGEGAARRLVGYLVPSEQASPTAGELRTALARRLPEHLIPAVFVELASLPRTPNGKIDRKALPAPDAAPAEDAASGAPRTPAEEMLAGLWAQVLGRERVGVHDNFFELGGHSLLATQVVSRIRLALDVEVPLSALFDHPTVAHLAEAVAAARPGRTAPPITPAERGGPLPLSFAQQRLWFLNQLEPDASEYNSLVMLRLPGTPDVPSLRRALDAVAERHEALRTRLVADDDGEPHQLIDPPAPVPLPTADLSGAPDPAGAARDLITSEASVPFDLATGPLLRAKLLTLAPDDHLLLLRLHHVVSDEWSAGVLRSELTALYEAFSRGEPSPLAPLPVQYADFAVWQRAWLSGDVLDGQLTHWRERLDGLPVLELPTDRTRPAERSSDGSAVGFRIPAEVTEALRALSRESGATMFMTLLAAFGVLLSRYADQEDVAVGTPIANRNRTETEGLIGFFVNTLVMRTDLSGDPTFRELLDRVRRTALDAYAHQDLPFEQLVDALQPDRDRTRHPLFQVMFDYGQNGAVPDAADGIDVPWQSTLFDLTLVLEEDGDGLAGALEYATDLFDEATARRMTAHLGALLAAVAADPGRHVADLPLLTPDELRRLVVEWNDTKAPLPASRTVHELVSARAVAHPEDDAVVFDERTLTYAALDARSDDLARHLGALGVGPETVVGLHLSRGPDLVTAVLATWKAGGAYLPLDPEYPQERLAFMLQDSGAGLLLTQTGVPGWDAGPTIRLDELETARTPPAHSLERPPGRHSLACVIYTSGSTGRPKGVQIEHGSLLGVYGAWAGAFMPDGTRHRWLSMASASFDVFTGDLVRALCSGGTLVLGADRLQASAADVAEAVKRHAVNAFEAAPRLVDELVDHVERTGEPLEPLRLLLVTTDAWRAAAVARTRRALGPDVMLRTAFGITEATIDSTSSALMGLAPDGPAPIGGPLANTRVHVLDRGLDPVPIGVPGELYIGGTGVARGYAGRPALTAERFVPDPFAGDGGRLYRSGDLVRLRPDGELEFLGRLDRQLKVRGYRVEPGEVEAALTGHPAVAASVVAAHGTNGDARLIGYVVPGENASGPPSTTELRAHLRRTLPDHLVPGVFVPLDALPLSPNGKVDRDALPAPDGARPGLAAGFTAPRGPAEEAVAAIWAEVLGLDRVGAHDDFFDLGGHSLLATRVLARTRAAFAVRLGLADVFDHPTVAGLGAVVEARLLEEIAAMSEDEVARELGRTHPDDPDGTDPADGTDPTDGVDGATR